MKSLVVCL